MKILDGKEADEAIVPVCPHCERELDSVYRVEDAEGLFKGHLGYCYVCPHCRKILGFADYAN